MGRPGGFGFSWSWRRASGLSAAKGKVSRAIGVPLTESGRNQKAGRIVGSAFATAPATKATPDRPAQVEGPVECESAREPEGDFAKAILLLASALAQLSALVFWLFLSIATLALLTISTTVYLLALMWKAIRGLCEALNSDFRSTSEVRVGAFVGRLVIAGTLLAAAALTTLAAAGAFRR